MDDTTSQNIIQILTFRLGDELFALDVSCVREVLDLVEIRKVPNTPDFMRGIINVRGNIIPVVDLGWKLGIKKTETSINTRIVVMDFNKDNDSTIVGAMADSVHEVIDLDISLLQDTPSINSRMKTDYIKGIANSNDEFIMLLDLDRIFSDVELEGVLDNDKQDDVSTTSDNTSEATD